MLMCNQCAGSGQVQGRTEVTDKHTGKKQGGHGGSGPSSGAVTQCQQCRGKGWID